MSLDSTHGEAPASAEASSSTPRPAPSTRSSLASLAFGLAAVVLVAAVHTTFRRFGWVGGRGDVLFALGFLVVAGAVSGSLAAAARLPRLVGYLAAGVLAGPQGIGLVDAGAVESLSLVNALALALIAVQAGAEITLPSLARIYKSVLWSSGAQLVVMIAPMTLVFVVASRWVPFARDIPTATVVALAVLWGVLMLTRSPTVTMALITESRAKGPLSEHALGVVVLLDVLVLPLFAAALAFARGALLGAPFQVHAFLALGKELAASACAGVTFGIVLALLLRVVKERVLVLVVFGYALTALCAYLRYDTLLAFVVAGFVVANLTKLGPALVGTSERTSSAVMIVFFATAGARIDVPGLISLWPAALAFCVARVALTILSTSLGHRFAHDPATVKKNAWLTFISQAGVTIGLASVVSDALPEVGRAFASLVIAVVSLNTFVGAVLCRVGLHRAGEAAA